MNKSTVSEIRERFDKDVERFSNLDTGQVTTVDAEISLELITECAKIIKPDAIQLLDIGCGAGNYTLKMLSKLPQLKCTVIDLSKPMLDRAQERVSKVSKNKIEIIQGDIREIDLQENHFDIILAGAVLHHLREDADWEFVFKKLFNALTRGGCLMISDLVAQDSVLVNDFIWTKYGDYIEKIGGKEYRQKVLDYVAKEDSPRSLNFQMELMKKIGFSNIEILHKNVCFAAYCAIK
ncbi:MAG: class I SAM-dependent methyltransferase [Bacteroidetes bacterium]|nr:class I SAM-dependent methyltransferase [Bacteroidota bacterium]